MIIKKTYYIFNPGRLQRKDNTLKFTPYDENGNEEKPRFLPVENVSELYCFGNLDANSAIMSAYQSHHTGIETNHFHNRICCYVGYQSHHTGIETGKFYTNSISCYTTNRTTLELKQRQYDALYWPTFSTNRTTLELKREYREGGTSLFSSYQSQHTGIAMSPL